MGETPKTGLVHQERQERQGRELEKNVERTKFLELTTDVEAG